MGERHVIRFCEGGESVSAGRTASLCSFCSNGRCVIATACEVPEAEPPKRRRRFLPTTPEGCGRLIGAVLGACGAIFIGFHVFRHLQLI